ncbi:hypothetical protein [Tahibacter amnicola]|uniref:Uncharacterized protein n=1 Tax=Tahibacter amnicola TaxID=2976241 RepID=A0ABY6BK07_9GAMM|nr:hypothetical protein [Tahibacter amnicola]UXI70200.1 hypothetical protein N4264_11375 [Tahibacter amnicola]
MNLVTTPRRTPRHAVASHLPAPLPVIDIGNNLIVCCGYLAAVESASLPSLITGDPQYSGLATAYADWQTSAWEQFFVGLLNAGVMAQAEEVSNLVSAGVTEQSAFQSLFTPAGSSVPTVISLCDDMASQVLAGETYVQQLTSIVQNIQGADEAKLAQLNGLVNQLNAQFDALEEQLTEKALDNSKEAVVTVIKVGIAVATEEDPVEPIIDGIAQIAEDIVEELVLTREIQQTLLALEAAWTELDEVTLQVAQLNLILQRLNLVVSDSSDTLNALNGLVNDWQVIVDTVNGSPSHWNDAGLPRLTEWASRLLRISFPSPVTQIIQSS